ncbi:sterol desaturase family protein [Aliterella atlantica]|uniref:Fatty acid hydroxylase domain-containing protein n=1 Tax=Aliterella atlantica CENA595 TaxID=1618023 RepID=A0A0D8ZNK1_9CYAN|nr:sterol desaturase family protein [Aliterella atlantica]KJH70059.1 hypothetical protein UH38_20105 [Aliterella atlantica CENA595]
MQVIIGIIVIAIAFTWLERKSPVRRQKLFRPGWFTDVCHWAFNQTIVNVGVIIGAIPLYILLGWTINPSFQSAIARQPGYLQFVEAVIVAEVSFYLVHRLFHKIPRLWKFHAIHHSSEHLDALASVRFHPVDMVAARLAIGTPLYILGFTAETFGFYTTFNLVQSIFVHANIRCRLPGLRWLISDPQLHRWHHSLDIDNKNFGHPLIDLLCGTLYNPPPGEFPRAVGVVQKVPVNYLRQLIYPLR